MCLKSVVLFYVAMNSHIVIDCIQFSVPTMHFMPFSVQYLFFIVWYFFSMNTCLVYAVLDIRATPVSHSLPIISSNICVFKREANFFIYVWIDGKTRTSIHRICYFCNKRFLCNTFALFSVSPTLCEPLFCEPFVTPFVRFADTVKMHMNFESVVSLRKKSI